MTPNIYYAIGDIHGEADKLKRLHGRLQRLHEREHADCTATLIHLGDYVDRGPESYEVIEHLLSLNMGPKWQIINLRGNHEQMMLEAFSDMAGSAGDFWIRNGGMQTQNSYRYHGHQVAPKRHITWLRSLPTYHWDRAAKLIFVHAGIDTEHFPNDGEDRHLWTRSSRFFDTTQWNNPILEDVTIVHGHTPTQSHLPDIDGDFKRINIDTGACYGGDLTAVILTPDRPPRFITDDG